MNLSPEWVGYLRKAGHDALHWSQIGPADAPDTDILGWAAETGRTVLTSDLDFGAFLATSGALGPSVVQLRLDATLPSRAGRQVVKALSQTEVELSSGALVTVEDDRLRLRLLNFAAKP